MHYLGMFPDHARGKVSQAITISSVLHLHDKLADLLADKRWFIPGVLANLQWDLLRTGPRESVMALRAAVKGDEGDIVGLDRHIGGLHGFKTLGEYYANVSSMHVMHRVTVPTTLITSADDPFLCDETQRLTGTLIHTTGPIKGMVLEQGGHVGVPLIEAACGLLNAM